MAIHISFCKSTSFQTVLWRLSFALRRSPDKAVHFFFKKKNNNKQNQSAMDCISVGLLLIPLLKPQQHRTLAFPCRTFLGFCSCWSTLQKKICLKKNKQTPFKEHSEFPSACFQCLLPKDCVFGILSRRPYRASST